MIFKLAICNMNFARSAVSLRLYIELEMCPRYTDAPAVAKFSYSQKTKAKKTFLCTKGNRPGSYEMIWMILKFEQDILMLSIVSKFP